MCLESPQSACQTSTELCDPAVPPESPGVLGSPGSSGPPGPPAPPEAPGAGDDDNTRSPEHDGAGSGTARAAVGQERPRILVADDDDDFREIVVEILAMAGWQPLQATSGQQALDMVTREQPDVLLIDQRMPGLRGDQVIGRLRANNQHLPIVLVTAAKNVDEIARALGIRFYLQKPVGLAQLKATIRQAMDGHADTV